MKRRAPPQAVKQGLANPVKQTSGVRPIALFTPSTSSIGIKLPVGQHITQVGHFLTPSWPTCRLCLGEKKHPASKQLTWLVGKYLHFLNPTIMEEQRLFKVNQVQEFLDSLDPPTTVGPKSCHKIHKTDGK